MSITIKPGVQPFPANRLGPVSTQAPRMSAHPTMGAVTSRTPLRILLQQESSTALTELLDACSAPLRAHHSYVEIPHGINEVQTEALPKAA